MITIEPGPYDPEQVSVESEVYLTFIRTHPCFRCRYLEQKGPDPFSIFQSEAHHVFAWGHGLRAPDFLTIPLCNDCHIGCLHGGGKESFLQELGLDSFWQPVGLYLAAFIESERRLGRESRDLHGAIHYYNQVREALSC